tara:strand:- start:198 stop:320 length:123 start_codon:yes stop_codon:yes gene_type:complete
MKIAIGWWNGLFQMTDGCTEVNRLAVVKTRFVAIRIAKQQ